MDEQLLTVEEVAQRIRRSQFTTRKYLRDRRIPAIKLEDGTWLVRASEVEAYINKRTYKPEEK